MKQRAVIGLILTLCLLGCDDHPIENLEFGSYSGEFTVFYNYQTEEQTSRAGSTMLTLDNNGYNLSEQIYVTPPLSAGSCSWGATTISFQDTIAHTAEFDWMLIINGPYVYSYDGTTLDMSQLDPDHKRKYRYILTKD